MTKKELMAALEKYPNDDDALVFTIYNNNTYILIEEIALLYNSTLHWE
jgi:hypothetical protein